MKKKYIKAPHCPFKQKDVNIIGPELERIFDRYGESKPDVIVREAKKKGSPLHPYFDWNDKSAAYKHRIEWAKYMIRSIRIEVITPKQQIVEVNIASSVVRPNIGPVYERTPVLLNRKADRKQLLDYAWRELEGFMARYSHFVEFEPIFKVVRVQMKKHR